MTKGYKRRSRRSRRGKGARKRFWVPDMQVLGCYVGVDFEAKVQKGWRNILIYGVAEPTEEHYKLAYNFQAKASKSSS